MYYLKVFDLFTRAKRWEQPIPVEQNVVCVHSGMFVVSQACLGTRELAPSGKKAVRFDVSW